MNMAVDEKPKAHWTLFNKQNAAILVMTVLVLAAVGCFLLTGCCCHQARRDQQFLDAHYCVEELDEILAMGWKKAKAEDGMDALAEEAAKETDKKVGPPPAYSPLKITPPRFDGRVK